jgi:hypothetical protein
VKKPALLAKLRGRGCSCFAHIPLILGPLEFGPNLWYNAHMPKRRKDEVVRTTYRVDLMLAIGSYAEYTSKKGTSLAMATSLANGLKRNNTGGRIVELPSNTVIDEWTGSNDPVKAS